MIKRKFDAGKTQTPTDRQTEKQKATSTIVKNCHLTTQEKSLATPFKKDISASKKARNFFKKTN